MLPEKKKEYACHVQYVARIGLRLAQELSADPDVVEIACLLHDVGRDKERDGENHAETSRRLAEGILQGSPLSGSQLQAIYASILTHGSVEVPEMVEQQIVRSSDAGSKVEYHEAFMLMCKKPTYEERLAWGMKYLEKGYRNVCIDSYRSEIQKKYEEISALYRDTLNTVQHVD